MLDWAWLGKKDIELQTKLGKVWKQKLESQFSAHLPTNILLNKREKKSMHLKTLLSKLLG